MLPIASPVMTRVRCWYGALRGRVAQPSRQHWRASAASSVVRLRVVVIVALEPQHREGMVEQHDQRLVEPFVKRVTVETLDIAVLLRPFDKLSRASYGEL